MQWDEDIAALPLSDGEKDGLQVYRNYTQAFDDHAEKEFAKLIDADPFNSSELERVFGLVATEDPRFLPVLACAYADDVMKTMFKAEVPASVPGGASRQFSAYGPFSDLFRKIQLAYIFQLLSSDILADLNKLRDARNKLSHTWDASKLGDFFVSMPVKDVFPIEEMIGERKDWFPDLKQPLDPLNAFRIRIIWLLARLAYEAPLYSRAKKLRAQPQRCLYGPNRPQRLTEVARLAMEASRKAIA